jgi:hypothetical protein
MGAKILPGVLNKKWANQKHAVKATNLAKTIKKIGCLSGSLSDQIE